MDNALKIDKKKKQKTKKKNKCNNNNSKMSIRIIYIYRTFSGIYFSESTFGRKRMKKNDTLDST